MRALARQHRVPAVDLERVRLDPRILKLIPAEFAVKHQVLPLRRVGRTLTVAMSNPTDLGVVDDLKFLTRLDIEPVIAGDFTLKRIVEREYESSDEKINELLKQFDQDEIEVVAEEQEDVSLTSLQQAVEEAPVVKLINGILDRRRAPRGAATSTSSRYEKELRVRFRIDGVLKEIMHPPLKIAAALSRASRSSRA